MPAVSLRDNSVHKFLEDPLEEDDFCYVLFAVVFPEIAAKRLDTAPLLVIVLSTDRYFDILDVLATKQQVGFYWSFQRVEKDRAESLWLLLESVFDDTFVLLHRGVSSEIIFVSHHSTAASWSATESLH